MIAWNPHGFKLGMAVVLVVCGLMLGFFGVAFAIQPNADVVALFILNILVGLVVVLVGIWLFRRESRHHQPSGTTEQDN